jgi:hypothetical protein
MKIRIEGTPEEIRTVLPTFRRTFTVRDESRFYPNRPPSSFGRVYLDIDPPASPPAAAGTPDPDDVGGSR